jgi:glutaredoxin-like YruB-family protein
MDNQKEVSIYSTSACHYCQMAKAFFQNNGVAYKDFNVAEDAEKRQEMIEMTGQMGVPVIKIGDEILVGFSEAKVREMIGM